VENSSILFVKTKGTAAIKEHAAKYYKYRYT